MEEKELPLIWTTTWISKEEAKEMWPDKSFSHPWMDFLNSRVKVIAWMKEDGKSDQEIAEILSMDAEQVNSILYACKKMQEKTEETS